MDSQKRNLISDSDNLLGIQNKQDNKSSGISSSVKSQQKKKENNEVSKLQEKKQDKSQKQQELDNSLIDVQNQLTKNNNPLPLLAILDKVNLQSKTKQGVPLFNLLMNKFLPIQNLLQNNKIIFSPDQDGRTPLHYAVEVDDPKAVYWLLKKNAHNSADKFGNTPVMDSIRLGHRRSFLIFMHFQLLSQQLPHIAAQYNRVWQLKCLLALGLNLQAKNNNDRTPLQVAIQNYSYEAVSYLSSVTNKYDIQNLKKFTDSSAIMKKVELGYKRRSLIQRVFKPLLYKFIPLFIIFVETYQINNFQDIKSTINSIILVLIASYFVMFLLSIFLKPSPKPSQSILSLLQQPQFPNSTDHICPSCLKRQHHQKQDHCYICHTCVPKFHQHTVFCINKSNQIVWYVFQFLYLYLLWLLLTHLVQNKRKTYPNQQGQIQSFLTTLVSIGYEFLQKQKNYIAFIFLLFIFGLALQQLMVCLQLFGMAFMDRTYQQTIRTQQYNHLYTVFKNKQGVLKTKQKRIFYSYKLIGGLCYGARNILCYFF